MDVLSGLVAIASSVAAILAWLAKMWWGREYRRAKDAQVELLQREIEGLRQLTPMKIREYFLSVRQQLEEYNEGLKNELAEIRTSLVQRTEEVEALRATGAMQVGRIAELEAEKDQVEARARFLESQITGIGIIDKAATSATEFASALAEAPAVLEPSKEAQRSLHRAVISLVEAGGLGGHDLVERYREYQRRKGANGGM